jgi:hypothetical protein
MDEGAILFVPRTNDVLANFVFMLGFDDSKIDIASMLGASE